MLLEQHTTSNVGYLLPNISIAIFAQALVVKAVDLGNLSGLVVAAQDSDSLWVSYFQSDKQSNGFDRIVAAIDVITCEGR